MTADEMRVAEMREWADAGATAWSLEEVRFLLDQLDEALAERDRHQKDAETASFWFGRLERQMLDARQRLAEATQHIQNLVASDPIVFEETYYRCVHCPAGGLPGPGRLALHPEQWSHDVGCPWEAAKEWLG